MNEVHGRWSMDDGGEEKGKEVRRKKLEYRM